MIPDRVIASSQQPAPFLPPNDREKTPLIDYELAGNGIQDPSLGLQVKVWKFQAINGDVFASATDVPPTLLFHRDNITEIAGAFDQNMNPAVAFVADGTLTLWWFDSVSQTQVFTDFAGNNSPRLCLDDNRQLENGTSDVILAYLRDGSLYFRAQRDRYEIETFLYDVTGNDFLQMGMNSVNRLQFSFQPSSTS